MLVCCSQETLRYNTYGCIKHNFFLFVSRPQCDCLCSAIALVGCKGFVAEILNCDCHVLPLLFFTVLQVCQEIYPIFWVGVALYIQFKGVTFILCSYFTNLSLSLLFKGVFDNEATVLLPVCDICLQNVVFKVLKLSFGWRQRQARIFWYIIFFLSWLRNLIPGMLTY